MASHWALVKKSFNNTSHFHCNSHSLLDAKIINVLSLCHDQAILNAVQSIIQNMIACEDVTQQQQLSYLQSKCIVIVYNRIVMMYLFKLILVHFIILANHLHHYCSFALETLYLCF